MRSAPESLFEYKRIMFPIHENSNHWTLMVIDLEQRALIYFNSKRTSRSRAAHYFHRVKRWLLRMRRSIPFDVDQGQPGRAMATPCMSLLPLNAPFPSRTSPSLE